ncbi:lipopolysaccharide transport periplasmic protein LptA [Xanthomonas massiliensis]|jgi:lipopolysaccharide export system protein LptA|uniref:lipopolysaccharide transport periplasmic protein LptA n=1 Tax=Xanthomonas massiliensis TaxID=1720302 RepID=UPI000826BE87|nr:lipopolysaccharide transport periplasmic protein LptA [Xanthomonas massiliensis]
MNPTRSTRPVALVLLAALVLPGMALARSSDRDQPMTIDASRNDCSQNGDDAKCRFSGDVVIIQGTLEIHADTADVYQTNGEVDRVVLNGKQATLKQQMDDGTTMHAQADNMDYKVSADTVVLTGNYQVQSQRGTNAGQRMVYNTRTGDMSSGGDGTRVRTVIQPKPKPAAAPAKPQGDR